MFSEETVPEQQKRDVHPEDRQQLDHLPGPRHSVTNTHEVAVILSPGSHGFWSESAHGYSRKDANVASQYDLSLQLRPPQTRGKLDPGVLHLGPRVVHLVHVSGPVDRLSHVSVPAPPTRGEGGDSGL